MENKQILLNSIQCLKCKDILISYHQHFMSTCSCGSCSADGGQSYLKRSFINKNDYKELSVYDNNRHMTRRSKLFWGQSYDKNMKRLKETRWVLIKNLDTDHIEAILQNVKTIHPLYKETLQREIIYRNNKNL